MHEFFKRSSLAAQIFTQFWGRKFVWLASARRIWVFFGLLFRTPFFLEEICEEFAMIIESRRRVKRVFRCKLSIIDSSSLQHIIYKGLDHDFICNFIIRKLKNHRSPMLNFVNISFISNLLTNFWKYSEKHSEGISYFFPEKEDMLILINL